MFVIFLNLIVIIFCVIVFSICGKRLLQKLKIEVFQDSISAYILGFLFMEMLCFISYLIFAGVFKFQFGVHLLPILLTVLWLLYYWVKSINKSAKRVQSYGQYYPVLILFLLISTLLGYEASSQFQTIFTNSGVLHIDMVYHAGISNSLLEYGYPIKDLQFDGAYIYYHIFTHYISAQLSYVSYLETHQVFILFFPFFSILCISLLLFDIVRSSVNKGNLTINYLIVGIITFLGAFFLPGPWGNASINGIFVSPSYQFELIFFIVIVQLIYLKNQEQYNLKDYIVLLVLFIFSIITKGSSMILLAGFGFLAVNRGLRLKKIILSDLIFLATATFLGIVVFIVFFSYSDSDTDFYFSFLGVNWRFIDSSFVNTILIKKLNINVNFLKYLTFIITIISFRYYLIKYIRHAVVSFVIGMSIAGLICFLFITTDPMNFLKGPFILLNMLFGIVLVNNFRSISKTNLLVIFALLPLSIYPISSLGFQMKKWQNGEIHRYYPISPERIALYNFINTYTEKDEIIFTPSVYGATNLSADNFYPASFSERNFYLGGYGYGHIKHFSSFKQRLELVDSFSFNEEQFHDLKTIDIKIVLIEYKGNKQDFSESIDEAISSGERKPYKVLFNNSAGIILELI